jgi:hypothetical protein
MGDNGPPFHWDPDRRALLRADLDAAMLHVYGLTRAESEHVLDSFPVLRKYEERDFGEYRTRRLVLEAFDRMADAAARGGHGWIPLATPPAGEGPRHPATPHPTVPLPRSSARPTMRATKRHPAPEGNEVGRA